jgi:hypothetical protein
MKRSIAFFVSYAHDDTRLAGGLLERLRRLMIPSRYYSYNLWRDTALLPGEDWDFEIRAALGASQLGLLLISPAFLGSDYISGVELPHFLGDREKPVIPVLLEPVDFARQDLRDLERKQIFALQAAGRKGLKAFADCRGPERRRFVEALFRQIEQRLDKILAASPAGGLP